MTLRDLRVERATRLAAARWSLFEMVPKTSRKLGPDLYTVMDVRWGMALDLSDADSRSLIVFRSHRWENQQWEPQLCCVYFVIKNVCSSLDLHGLHRDASTEVVAG